jgi:hypothetical protein
VLAGRVAFSTPEPIPPSPGYLGIPANTWDFKGFELDLFGSQIQGDLRGDSVGGLILHSFQGSPSPEPIPPSPGERLPSLRLIGSWAGPRYGAADEGTNSSIHFVGSFKARRRSQWGRLLASLFY